MDRGRPDVGIWSDTASLGAWDRRSTVPPEREARMTIEWFVPPGEVGSINRALHSLMVATRAEPGCVGCSLSTNLGERAGLHYVETWKSETDLIMHLRSSRFATITQLMESATERPRVEFQLPGGTRGFEYAEEVREQLGEI